MALQLLPKSVIAQVQLSPWFLDLHHVTGTNGRGTYDTNWKNDKQLHYSEKFGMQDGRDYPVFKHTAAMGSKVGLQYAMPVGGIVGSTIRAHRLLMHAAKENKHVELAMELFRSYYQQTSESPWDITSTNALQVCANKVGMDPEASAAFLATNDGEDEVRERVAANEAAGVTGVPLIMITSEMTNGHSGTEHKRVLHGAVPVETIRAAIIDIAEKVARESPRSQICHTAGARDAHVCGTFNTGCS